MNSKVKSFLLILAGLILAGITLTRSFLNFRQGIQSTGLNSLAILTAGLLILAFLFPRSKGPLLKWILIRVFSALLLTAALIAMLWMALPSPDNRLYSAVIKNDLRKAERVLNRYPREMSTETRLAGRISLGQMESSLCRAVRAGHWDMVELLVEQGVNLNNYLLPDESPLQIAVDMGSTDAYDRLVELGADPQYRMGQQLFASLPLNRDFDKDMLTHLINCGVDPNIHLREKDSWPLPSNPPLHTLVAYLERAENPDALWEAMATLTALGADINLLDREGETPYMKTEDEASRRRLVRIGAVPIERDENEETALHRAIGERDVDRVRELLETQPLLLEISGDARIRPLFKACVQYDPSLPGESLEIIEALLEAGADPNKRILAGEYAILELMWYEDVLPLAELLIEYGAEWDVQFKDRTVLTRTIDSNNPEGLAYFLERGARPKQEWIEMARQNRFRPEINRILTDYGEE